MTKTEFLELTSGLITSRDGKTLYSIESIHVDNQDNLYGTVLAILVVEDSQTGHKNKISLNRQNYKHYKKYIGFNVPEEE